MEQPKRALTTYNLFYRFKRSKILEAHKNGDVSNETINRLIMAVPGLEEYPSIATTMSLENVKWLRRTGIRSALQENLSPKDTSNRSHRKSHGCISFLEMNTIMCASWKSIDDFTRSVFNELAEEGRRMYRKRVAEYEENFQPSPKKKKIKPSSDTYAPKKSQVKILHVDKPRNSKDVVLQSSQATDLTLSNLKTDKEANTERPKRTLSSYNLFYRYKRSKILDLEANKRGIYSEETINRLITAMPGLEDYSSIASTMSPNHVKELRRTEIRLALRDNLFPKDAKTRTRCKFHASCMSYVEMNRKVCASWKSIDDFAKSVFDELAEEGRKVYYKRVAEYEEKYPSTPTEKIKPSKPIATPKKTQLKKLRIDMPTGPATDGIFATPKATKKRILPIVSPVVPVVQSSRGCLDQMSDTLPLLSDMFDLGGMNVDEPIIISPDMFELEESCVDERVPMNYVAGAGVGGSAFYNIAAQPSSEYEVLGDVPPLSVSCVEEQEPKKCESEASVEDFMKLITILVDNLGD